MNIDIIPAHFEHVGMMTLAFSSRQCYIRPHRAASMADPSSFFFFKSFFFFFHWNRLKNLMTLNDFRTLCLPINETSDLHASRFDL